MKSAYFLVPFQNCANQTDITDQGITLPPAADPRVPDPTLVGVVVIILVTDPVTGVKVQLLQLILCAIFFSTFRTSLFYGQIPVTDLPDGEVITFEIPLLPEEIPNVATRLVAGEGLKCSKTELRCEFWDLETAASSCS